MSNEADTCRTLVLPKLYAAGWTDEQLAEQRTYTDGRIIPRGTGGSRKKPKRVDYLLRYTRDFSIAVVEAKARYKNAADGLQQAKDYATDLGLKFAYATNGTEIIEFDFLTGKETNRPGFPAPAELWQRLKGAEKISDGTQATLLAPYNLTTGKIPRYYQDIAIHRAIEAFLKGQRRVLLTLATGTGKTTVAFQICWKLWSSGWRAPSYPLSASTGERAGVRCRSESANSAVENSESKSPSSSAESVSSVVTPPKIGKPRILFLADRNFLVDDPKEKDFAPFDKARIKIEGGQVTYSREIYFSTYQAIAKDENRPGLYKQFPPDFFDLIVVDECHRGSAKEDSNWREILEYFEPAYQLGMTATPLRDENRDTYLYFGNPVYTYSLKQGRDDGFLAPYRVHRIVTEWDAAGWRPSKEDLDRYGRQIPDEEYTTPDFERRVALRARTEAVARHLTDFLKKTDRFAKTIVFCVDQEHASEMRTALNNLNSDLVGSQSNPLRLDRGEGKGEVSNSPVAAGPFPDYVCRVTADEGDIGKGHMGRFQDVETRTPTILTTSQLLTTGLDAPTCKNVVLVRLVNSMVEFKQIIGRGTRVREDYGKLWFNILDYTGAATAKFADPAFDGEPDFATVEEIDEYGKSKSVESVESVDNTDPDSLPSVLTPDPLSASTGEREGVRCRKYYYDGGHTEIAAHIIHEIDPDGHQLYCASITDYTGQKVRTLAKDSEDLRKRWVDPDQRADIINKFAERGIDFQSLALEAGKPDADPFDLLCHLGFNAPMLTRRQRADRFLKNRAEFFQKFGPDARAVLADLLEKYAADGEVQFVLPDVLKLDPIARHGNIKEIAGKFGGADNLRSAVDSLQTFLYAA